MKVVCLMAIVLVLICGFTVEVTYQGKKTKVVNIPSISERFGI